MKTVLIYYPFPLATKANSGSTLRPLEMIKAFEEWAHNEGVYLAVISGESKERKEKFKRLRKQGLLENILFCYVENQSIPIWVTDRNHIPKRPFVDWEVFYFLKRRRVPIGIFYRDVYWKFDELYTVKGMKKKILRMLYKLEEKFFQRYASVIFLPSLLMGSYVNINKHKVALPPGGKRPKVPIKSVQNTIIKSIYVGGISHPDYGLSLLVDALEICKHSGIDLSLNIVCRESELHTIPQTTRLKMNQLGVQILHASGVELDLLYSEMNFAFIPRKISTYNNFSVPVKLVEYLSHQVSIIATNCKAQKELIESGPYGVICEDNSKSIADAIKKMICKDSIYRININEHFLSDHSWLSRVRTISHYLAQEGPAE